MQKAEQEIQNEIDKLLTQIRDLKMKVDEQHQRERDLSQAMSEFEMQYDAYLQELDRQHRALEQQIFHSRKSIQRLKEGSAPLEDEDEELTKPAPNDDEAPSPSAAPPIAKNKQQQQNKKQIRHHFARFWHPDKQRVESDSNRELMVTLNILFDESHDATEMLISLPWNEVWKKRRQNESIGAQWERLTEWQTCLKEANQRLATRLDEHKEDWRYLHSKKWEAGERKQDYFATLASQKRAQIRQLQQTVAALQAILNTPPPISREEALARIELVWGDLFDQQVDVLVHPTSSDLDFGGMIGEKIIERLGNDFYETVHRQAPLGIGEAITTDAGPLLARYLIHVDIHQGTSYTTVETLAQAASVALNEVERLNNVQTIAFPSIGTGAGGVPPLYVAPKLLTLVLDHLMSGSQLEKVIFAFLNQNAYQAYLNAYQALRQAGHNQIPPIPPGFKLRHTLREHSDQITRIAWTADGRRLLSASRDSTIQLWDPQDGLKLITLRGHSMSVNAVALLPNGQHVVSASRDKTLRIWDLETGLTLQTLIGHTHWVSAVAVLPDGQRIISASFDKTLKIWDLTNGVELFTLHGHTRAINAVAVLPDGQHAISASWDQSVRVWDIENKKVLRTLHGHANGANDITWLPDHQTLVVPYEDGTIRLWNLPSGDLIRSLEGHTSYVTGVCISFDGRLLASKSADGTVRLWRGDSWEQIVVLDELASSFEFTGLAFHPADSTVLATLGENNTAIRIWELDLDILLGETPAVSMQDVVVDVQLNLPDEPVFVGEEFKVGVSLRPGGRGEGCFCSLSIAKERVMGGEVNLFLEPQGLQVRGSKEDSLPLMASTSALDESNRQIEPQALFRVSASRPGVVEIRVDLYFEESFRESLVGEVEVEAADLGLIKRRVMPRPVPQPDLVLQVASEWNKDGSAVRFRYRLDGFRGASFQMDGLSSPWLAVGWLEQVRGLLGVTIEGIGLGLVADARARLKSFGRSLYREVLDHDLQKVFKGAGWGHTLLIVADQEAWLPWELLHDGRGFLGERFLIGRWPRESDDSRPYEFPIGAVSVAHYASIERIEEPDMWAQLLKPPFKELEPEILSGGVLDLKHVDRLRGLHLIRRAQLEQRNLPVPIKEQEETIAKEVQTSKLSLRRNRPLVTLSYLSAGQAELTQLTQSWAPTYINAGCSAFIGPLWAVDEAVEAAFVGTFYASLWKGASLGEAFRRAQHMARVAVPERLDWLAYILFGDPMARPYRPVEGDGYAVVEPVGRQIEQPIFPGESVRFRVSLRRTPPVWHEDRVVEVAQELEFDDLQVHVMARDVTILPKSVIVMQRTPTKDYLGWFTLLMPTKIKRKKTGVQVFFVDGEKSIHTLTIPLKVGKTRKGSR